MVSIITVSFNSQDFIRDYLESVLKYRGRAEVIVVDSGSDDETVEIIKQYPVKLIESPKNIGFGGGNNLGVKSAKGEYLFFLNPDTKVKSEFLTELVNFYSSDPKIGLVGPKLLLKNGQIQPSVRKLPTVWGAIKEYLLGQKQAYSQYIPETDQPIEVESLYGAALLIKKDLFLRLGGFDERFFMYYEDTDLCRRVRSQGYKIYYYPKVVITHLVGATKSRESKYRMNLKSSRIYHGFLGSLLLSLIFTFPRLRRRFHLG